MQSLCCDHEDSMLVSGQAIRLLQENLTAGWKPPFRRVLTVLDVWLMAMVLIRSKRSKKVKNYEKAQKNGEMPWKIKNSIFLKIEYCDFKFSGF